jgi:serine/threonine protein kinase
VTEFVADQRVPATRTTYTVTRKLGEGGFGIAFLAVDALGQQVVLKQLQLARMGDWKAMELFEREARVLTSLRHPGIPRCHDFFATDGQRVVAAGEVAQLGAGASLVLVQDYVEGASLQARIDAGERLTSREVEALLRVLLGVLDYLHDLHPPVIHRDIKPGNIVITPAGAPMLVDFGASQERLRRESELGSTSVGTFGYFPIEQVLGKARPASDLYALAMTLVVALTHRPPEDLPLDPDTSKVLVVAAVPGLPDRLARALDGMLEPAIGRRISSATAALAVLDGAALAPVASTPAALVRPMPPLEWKLPLWGGSLGAAAIYVVFFDSFSESELVQVSFLWAPLVAFGLGGKLTRARKTALTWALLTFVGLVAFFALVFPSM